MNQENQTDAVSGLRPTEAAIADCVNVRARPPVWVMREYDTELGALACAAEFAISKACELRWLGDDWKTTAVDEADLDARAHVIELLGDGDTLLFPVGDQVVQVVGAEHMVFDASGLRLTDIAAKAAAGHASAQRIYRELTEGPGVVIHVRAEAEAGRTARLEYPADEQWIAERRERLKTALDVALDLTARHAERMLGEVGEVGMTLIPLDARLQPLDGLQVPLDHIPPTSAARRLHVEHLARGNFLKAAAGYIALAETWRAPAEWSGRPSDYSARQEGVILQAETRARDCCTRLYNIIRRPGEPPKLELVNQSREAPPGLLSGLLQVADAVPERKCVDDGLLQTALAAHAETIKTLGLGDMLMFAVGDELVQVIGTEHTVRECMMLRLADIKASAAAGDRRAQRFYYELTAGRGLVIRIERGPDGRDRAKMKFPSEEGWFSEGDAGLNRVSLDRERLH